MLSQNHQVTKSNNSNRLNKLLAEGSSVDHCLVEVDGQYCKPEKDAILEAYHKYNYALIRISKHLYLNRFLLTIGGPLWSDLFPTEQDRDIREEET